MRLASIVSLTAGGVGSGRYPKGSGITKATLHYSQTHSKPWIHFYGVHDQNGEYVATLSLRNHKTASLKSDLPMEPVSEAHKLKANLFTNKSSGHDFNEMTPAGPLYQAHLDVIKDVLRQIADLYPKATLVVGDRITGINKPRAGEKNSGVSKYNLDRLRAELKAGGVGSGRYPKGSGVDRSAIAKRNKIQIVGLKEQQLARQSEHEFEAGTGIPRVGGNGPFDHQNQSIGVELKTLIYQKNDKITMEKKALARKNAEAQKLGLRTYTVVVDKRSSPTTYYYAKGLGSFVIRGMHKVNSMKELKGAIK